MPLSSGHRVWVAHLAAALLALALNLQLRWAHQLGFYEVDYDQILRFLYGANTLADSWVNVFRYLLVDEPLLHVYHALRYQLLGADPWPHHLLRGCLLTINATLAFSLVWRLSKNLALSFVFLFLFLTYPNRSEAIFWHAALYVPLLFWLLVACHLCLSWFESPRWRIYAALWLTYTIAIFTHEAAFGFLAVIAALWLLERPAAHSWRHGARLLLPLLLSHAAYLVVRQTYWFGFGDPSHLTDRPLKAIVLFENMVFSLRANFGERFAAAAQQQLRQVPGGEGLSLAFAVIVACLLAAAGFLGARRDIRPRLEGVLLLLAGITAAGLYTRHIPLPDPAETLPLALRAMALLAFGALLKARLSGDPFDTRLLRLALLGVAWFFAAYAPTYVYYVADRHSYLPSLGACLLFSVALWFPTTVAAGRRRLVLEGVALGLAAYIASCFYGASLAEGRPWVGAHQFLAGLKAQLLQARPNLHSDATVVVLGLPDSWPGVQMPGSTIEAAIRVWYRNPPAAISRTLIPAKRDFRLPAVSHPRPYERLLLFTYKDQVLIERTHLVFEDGERIRIGSAFESQTKSAGAPPLPVVAGRPME